MGEWGPDRRAFSVEGATSIETIGTQAIGSPELTAIATVPKIFVFFGCQKCPMVYRAEQSRGQTAGRFICAECGHTVTVWSGHFTLSGWTAVEVETEFGQLPKAEKPSRRKKNELRR